ncbi:hypothetical protein A8E23_18235 [Burkholderia cenocepacia]|nr:hypothetical protein A8E23_18235 [Burkholderia cenocepacia]
MMIGIVSLNVYDRFGNVAIPKGSKLIGQTIRQVNDRREVQWSGLQLPGTATLQFDPPLEGLYAGWFGRYHCLSSSTAWL